ncbi:MAG: group II intron maturase-specific domain-containing protein [Caldilineaceae bacterium]
MRISAQSLGRIKRKVKQLTWRTQNRGWLEIRDSLRRAVTGWVNYYALADAKRHMAELDEHLRRRMRQLAWKQWKTRKRRTQRLKQLGVSDYWAIRAGGASQGPWRMSKSPPLHQALSNQYWRKVGLVSFSHLYHLRQT